MWIPDLIAEIAAAGLRARTDELAAEQAVRGLDSFSELELHPVLAGGFEAAGLGVFREQPYPGDASLRPKHAARERCDLVLTATPGLPLFDPVAGLKAMDAAAGTLFADAASSMMASQPAVNPAEALWIEIKSVGQFCYTHGVPGPNRAYSAELLTIARSDIPKLSKDPLIESAAVLVVLFAATREVAEHDLAAFSHRCLDRDLPISTPATNGFPIPDIIGNAWCAVAIVPVRPCRM